MALRLIVGLGNPGAQYAKTRHNVGAWLLAVLAAKHGLVFHEESKFSAQLTTLTANGQSSWLMIPGVFMNDSGRSVQAVAHFYKVAPEEILVVHDEMDFPTGVIRLKAGGGHGGHNGLRDIIQCLGSHAFYRLRIGIDHPGHRDLVTPYVLGEPSTHDKAKITRAIDDALPIIPDLMVGAIDSAFRYLHHD